MHSNERKIGGGQILTKSRADEEKRRRHLYGDAGAKYSQNLEPRHDGCSNTITTVQKDNLLLTSSTLINNDLIMEQNVRIRIRKLTERECFRLMDVDDKDIDRIQAAGISKTQQYKMAGNSICVGVLYELFKNMFINTGDNQPRQLTLF